MESESISERDMNIENEIQNDDSNIEDPLIDDTQESNIDAIVFRNQNEDNAILKMVNLCMTYSKKIALDGFQSIQSLASTKYDLLEEENYEPSTKKERVLSKYAGTYELEKFNKNALIIFNQHDINSFPEPRHGTDKDVEALQTTFENFGFEVENNIHTDLSRDDLLEKLAEFTSRDYTDYGCIGVVVLTHGSNFGTLWAKDRTYSERKIISHLKDHNKPTLAMKPKFLFIQACRGGKSNPPVPVLQPGEVQLNTKTGSELEPYYLPEDSDMLILHSCYMGGISFRPVIEGSWFIQSLCKTIDHLAPTHDLESILTVVKRVVAIDKYQAERHNPRVQMGQMPISTSTLTRKLFFKKSGEPSLDTGLIQDDIVRELSQPTMTPPSSPVNTDAPAAAVAPAEPPLVHFEPYAFIIILIIHLFISICNKSLNIQINLN